MVPTDRGGGRQTNREGNGDTYGDYDDVSGKRKVREGGVTKVQV